MRHVNSTLFKQIFIAFLFIFSSQITKADVTFHGQLCTSPTSDIVKLEITTENFTNLLTFQYTFVWDTEALQYHSIGEFGLPHFTSSDVGKVFTDEGKLTFVWFDKEVTPQTLEDGSTLFVVYFLKVSDEDPQFDINSSFTAIEVVNGDGEIENLSFEFNEDPCNFNPDPATSVKETPIDRVSAQLQPNVLLVNETAILALSSHESANFEIDLFNISGQHIQKQTLVHQSGITRQELNFPQIRGLYFIRISDKFGGKKTLKVVVQ